MAIGVLVSLFSISQSHHLYSFMTVLAPPTRHDFGEKRDVYQIGRKTFVLDFLGPYHSLSGRQPISEDY